MTKFIAVHLLHLASAVKGKTDVVNPGELFESAEHDDIDRLKAIGAIRKPNDHDKHAVIAVRAGTEPGGSSEDDDGEDLAKLKKADLVALAEKEQIEVDASATKEVIIAAIEAGRAAKADAESLV